MEKSQAQQRAVATSDNQSDNSKSAADQDAPHWQPGYMKRFPYVGTAGLLIVLFTAVASAAILCISDNKSSVQWTQNFAPNVALSVLTALGNIALVMAFMRGISIAWWRKAMNGATVAELHQSWTYTASAFGVLSGIFHLDVIGVAVIATKLAVIDGIFYQRATSTYVGQDAARSVSMLGVAATDFPTTGYIVSEGYAAQTSCACFMIGDIYTPVLNTWETSNGFFQGYNKLFQQCNGVCYTHINAIGFEIDCITNENHTDIAAAPIAAYQSSSARQGNDSAAWSNIPIFNSSFYMSFADTTTNYSSIVLDLQYFQSDNPYNPSGASCAGSSFSVQCKLRPALISYPLTITNFSNPHVVNGVALGSGINQTSYDTYLQASNQNIQPYSSKLKQAEGFEVLSYLYPNETGTLNSTTYLGGIANALHLALSSSATITYEGSGDWALSQQGTLSQTMMYGPPNMGSCDCSFRSEALDTIVAQVNQLTFLTATGLIDDTVITFPAGSSSTTAGFSFTVSEPALTVNTSMPISVQGIGSNTTTYFRDLPNTIEVRDVTYYRTHYLFLGLGVGTTLVCATLVAALYWRYGQLGRDVTLGPIEVAGAFGAPVLTAPVEPSSPTVPQSPAKPNRTRPKSLIPPSPTFASPQSPTSPTAVSFANVNELVASVGDRRVVYGFVDVEEDVDDGPVHQTATAKGSQPGSAPQSPVIQVVPASPGGNGEKSSNARKRRSQILTFAPAAAGNVRPISGNNTVPMSNPHMFDDDVEM